MASPTTTSINSWRLIAAPGPGRRFQTKNWRSSSMARCRRNSCSTANSSSCGCGAHRRRGSWRLSCPIETRCSRGGAKGWSHGGKAFTFECRVRQADLGDSGGASSGRSIMPTQTAIEFPDERQQMSVYDLFGGGDFLELAFVGWPAHPLRLGDEVPDATIRPEFAPQLESPPQRSVVRGFALRAIGEPLGLVLARREGEGAVGQVEFRGPPSCPRA